LSRLDLSQFLLVIGHQTLLRRCRNTVQLLDTAVELTDNPVQTLLKALVLLLEEGSQLFAALDELLSIEELGGLLVALPFGLGNPPGGAGFCLVVAGRFGLLRFYGLLYGRWGLFGNNFLVRHQAFLTAHIRQTSLSLSRR
jgi:hypothetical protein